MTNRKPYPMGPEQERLMDRLFNDPTRELLNFHVWSGDKAATSEQICAEVNKAMDQSERRRASGDFGDGPVKTGKPRVNLRQLVDGL
jgi:hypothetical protein